MASLRKIRDRYYLLYRDDEGKQHSKPLGKIGKRDAQRELARFETPMAAGMAFGLFCEKYLAWHKFEYPASHDRIYQIVNDHLLPVFRFTAIGALAPAAVEHYKVDRLKLAKPATVQKEIRTLKAIVNKAVEWGHVPASTIRHVRPPKDTTDAPPPFYTADELARLYASSNALHCGIWQLGANSGLRRRELLQLRKEDLKEQGIYVVSRDGSRTKSGKWRLVPWTDGARQAIESLRSDGEFVLPRMHQASLSRAFVTDAKRAKLPGSLHWLRHTYASHLVMAGFPLRMVQQVMGHSTIAVTERYAHLSEDYMREKLGEFSI